MSQVLILSKANADSKWISNIDVHTFSKVNAELYSTILDEIGGDVVLINASPE